jgi:hypothetical protein
MATVGRGSVGAAACPQAANSNSAARIVPTGISVLAWCLNASLLIIRISSAGSGYDTTAITIIQLYCIQAIKIDDIIIINMTITC